MIASNVPDSRRYGRRLKKRVENLYADWFGPTWPGTYSATPLMWAQG